MTSEDLAQQLVDSKRFCAQFRVAAMNWTSRSLKDDDRVRMLAPIVASIVEELEMGAPEPEPVKRDVRHTAALRPKQQELAPGIELGSLGDKVDELDPFKHPEDQRSMPSPEPDPGQKLIENFKVLVDAVKAAPPTAYGRELALMMPHDWAAGEIGKFINQPEMKGWGLVPDGRHLKFVPANAGGPGWLLTLIKQM